MKSAISNYIDHTLLKADATPVEIEKLCKEAIENKFFSVCVNSVYVPLCKKLLSGSSVKTVSVIGFPLGAMATQCKAFETKWAVENGAEEIDMVLALGLFKSEQDAEVIKDIEAVVEAAQGKKVKVILETCLLSPDQIKKASQLCLDAGAHFVKTSTGFSTGGAKLEDVKIMKSVVGNQAEVKASGGVKNLEQAQAMIDAGATRLGTSSGVQIVQGQTVSGGY